MLDPAIYIYTICYRYIYKIYIYKVYILVYNNASSGLSGPKSQGEEDSVLTSPDVIANPLIYILARKNPSKRGSDQGEKEEGVKGSKPKSAYT